MDQGPDKNNNKNAPAATILTLALHAILPTAWFVFAMFVAPLFMDSLDGLGVNSGQTISAALRLAELSGRYGWLFAGIMACFLAADGLIYTALLRSNGRSTAAFWSATVVLLQIAATVFIIISVYLLLLKVTAAQT